jgi:NAD(P)-dependent dehydrogenase (short-subunit alcohol dehydrogenase family)
VSLVGLEPELLAEVHSGLPGGPDRHAWFTADVTDSAALEAACAGTAERLGGIDALVANAGVANLGTVAVGDFDALLRTIEVNLIGVVRSVRAALPYVVERRGYLMLISSAAAFTALPGMAAYCAAKAGVEQFANVLRMEQAPAGVAVGTVHPSWVDTDLVRDMRADMAAFAGAQSRLPWPMRTTTSVDRCALAIVDGLERRRRKVYVPRSVALVQALRPLVLSAAMDRVIGWRARNLVPLLEREVTRLGRGFGEHSVGTGR